MARWFRSKPQKIAIALMKHFWPSTVPKGAASASVREVVDALTQGVTRALMRSRPGGGTFHIEDVQDQVELGLMRGGHHRSGACYVLYRSAAHKNAPTRSATGPSGTPR